MTPYYEEPGLTLYHGDCLDVLPTLAPGSCGGFVTDPPYTSAGSSSNGRSSEAEDQFFSFWFRSVCEEIRRVTHETGAGFVFCDWRTVGIVRAEMRSPGSSVRYSGGGGWTVSQALAWDRDGIGMGSPFRNSFEMIAFCRAAKWRSDHMPNDIPSVIRHRWPYGRKEYNDAEKPVPLCERLVRWTGAERRIVDPFAGSGTTLLAARRAGVECIGIELSERACEQAASRLAQAPLELTG